MRGPWKTVFWTNALKCRMFIDDFSSDGENLQLAKSSKLIPAVSNIFLTVLYVYVIRQDVIICADLWCCTALHHPCLNKNISFRKSPLSNLCIFHYCSVPVCLISSKESEFGVQMCRGDV